MEDVSIEKEIGLLLNNFWVTKDNDKENYYLLKKNQDKIRDFLHRTCGSKLIVHDRFVKLEKIPANARKEFGISEFVQVLDYVILFLMLLYLEDRTRGDKFILSELVLYIKNTAITLKLEHIPNWDNASDRRSLIRVITFLMDLDVIFLRDQDNRSFQENRYADALYEVTGLANYVVPSFDFDIFNCEVPDDFLELEWHDQDIEKGEVRKFKVYRHLLYAPATTRNELTWGEDDYVKHLHKTIERELIDKVGMQVEITKNLYMVFTDEYAVSKEYFPNTRNMSDIILLINKALIEYREKMGIAVEDSEIFNLTKGEFENVIKALFQDKKEYFSKKYTIMPENKLYEEIVMALGRYHFIEENGENVIVYPLIYRFVAKVEGVQKNNFEQIMNEGELNEF